MSKKILLVDDAAFMRKMIKDTLTKAGYTDLYEAVDGADAVVKYGEVRPTWSSWISPCPTWTAWRP